MRLEWIAAVLRPADIAPHSAFRNDTYDSLPHATLAAAVLGEPDLSGSWPNLSGEEKEAPLAPESDRRVVDAAIRTFHDDSIREGANELRHLVADHELDAAVAVAAALVGVCALARLEEYEACETILTDALDRLGQDRADLLLRACLLQQVCLRRRDWAVDYSAPLEETYRLLTHLRLDATFPSFSLGPRAIGDSDQTLRHILVALRYAVWSISPHDFDTREVRDLPTFESMFKFEESDELLHRVENAADQYRRSCEDQYRFFFDDGAAYAGRLLPDLFYYNLAHELYGHGGVYQTRKELALFYLTQAATTGRPVDAAECLRLLRYSNADDELALAVRSLRYGGPLGALSKDARQAIAKRMTPQRVRQADLIVIRGAAELLTESEAGTALEAGFELIDARSQMNVVGRWTAFSKRLETTWRTVAELANAADRADAAALKMLGDLRTASHEEDLDRVYARTVRVLKWSQVTDGVKTQWRRWLVEPANEWCQTAVLVRLSVGIQSTPNDTEDLSLTDIANLINDTANGFPIEPQLMGQCTNKIRASLERLQSTSIRGPWGMGGLDIADIAANLVKLGATELVAPLTSLLVDTRVPRTYRSGALDRLASNDAPLDNDSITQFQTNASGMLWAPDTLPLGGELYSPHPAALRFLSFHHLITEEDAFEGITHLAGSADRLARVEAARSISMISETWDLSWLLSTAIQLTYDASAETRGYAAHALARVVGKSAEAARLGNQRLRSLLSTDGLIVPLLALRGLKTAAPERAYPFTDLIEKLSNSHPSRLVRNEAGALRVG